MDIKPGTILLKIFDFAVLIGLASLCLTPDLEKPLYDTYVSCNDERYRHPLLSVSQHFVPTLWLQIGVLVILPGLFFAVEAILMFGFPRVQRQNNHRKQTSLLAEFCDVIALYYSGLVFLFIITKISRSVGGSPAPYFLTLCSPGCSNNSTSYVDESTGRIYVTQLSCPRESMLSDTLASFPSSHALLSFYAATFVALSYSSKKSTSYPRLLQPAMVILAVVLAIVTSLSRISEYSNHVVDVVAGTGIGVAVACVQILVVGKKVKQEDALPLPHIKKHLLPKMN